MRILYSNSIFTGETDKPISGAVVIDGDKILYVGSKEKAEMYRENAEIQDFGDSTILPGLIDCHSHAFLGARMMTMTTMWAETSYTKQELIDAIHAFIKENPRPKDPFYLVLNYDFENTGKLTRTMLDVEFGQDVPLVIIDMTLHGGVYSSKALQILGCDPAAPAPVGSQIDYEEDGTLGYISETLHFELFFKIISTEDDESLERAVDYSQHFFNSNGYTTVGDMLPLGHVEMWSRKKYAQLVNEGNMSLRVGFATSLLDSPENWRRDREDFKGDLIFHCGLKGFMDGGVTNSTAWIAGKYVDGPQKGGSGGPSCDLETYQSQIQQANKMGIGVRLHAEGDAAVSKAISMFATAQNCSVRNSVEHATLLSDHEITQIKEYTKNAVLCLNMQPSFLYNEAPSPTYRVSVGEEYYNRRAVRTKSVLQAGANLTIGADYPAVQPLLGRHIAMAVNRLCDVEGSFFYGKGYQTQEAITLPEAVKAMTVNAAMTLCKENVIGRLKPGYKADIAVLNCDIFALKPAQYTSIDIHKTYFDGRQVYSK